MTQEDLLLANFTQEMKQLERKGIVIRLNLHLPDRRAAAGAAASEIQ